MDRNGKGLLQSILNKSVWKAFALVHASIPQHERKAGIGSTTYSAGRPKLGKIVLVVAALLLFVMQGEAVFARSPGSGLWVKQVIPKGVAAPFDKIEIRFSEPIQAGSFTAGDVRLNGFASGIPVQLAPDAYEVSFSPSTGLSVYSLTIGPNILDAEGRAMDQDGDGIRGEDPEDAFHGTLFATAATIDDGDTTYDGRYLVINNCTVTINGGHAFGGIGLYNAGVITHSATTQDTVYKTELTLSDELYIDAASRIDVTGKGYLRGFTAGNTTSGGAQSRAGGTFGGEGFVPSASTGPTNRAYGDYKDPAEPGSGGGTNWSGAGSGGGVVRITADSATINGSVLANGGNGGFSADPAGSGGSIRLDVGTLSGVGVIAAGGGNGHVSGGSGGGGRVAIYYEDMSGFTLANVQSHGGKGAGNAGGAGSVYLKPSGGMGTLRIDTHITANDSTQRALTPLGIPGEETFQVERLVIAGRYSVAVPERAGLTVQAEEIVIESGGALSHRAATEAEVFALEVTTGALTIDSHGESRIDVSWKGYLAGRTLSNETTGAARDLSGGAYGGEGFSPSASTGPTNRAYGDYRNPTEPGSGGGLHLAWGAGSGGGVIKITANSATIDGSVLSNGGNGGFSADPAGSGGSIRLDVGTLSGTGIIAADGGNGYVSGGSGGGGRVAVYYEDMSGFSLSNVQAHGGKGAGNAGGAGSVYLKPSGGMGTLRIDTHITANDSTQRALTPLGIPGEETFQVERLVIAGRYSVAVPERTGLVIQAEEIVIESGGALSHRAATATEVFTLELSTGTLAIDAHSESRIDVSGKGYLRGFTAGNTMSGGAQSRAGGTFGGEGFVPPTYGPTNRAYGDYTNPNVPGSGGGTNWSGAGSGGGVVRITADSATINGSVLANGGNGGFSADPAGSGGSIRLDVGILLGAGVIAANGGNGYVSGGSGGGGRVAIYYEDMSGFTLANVRTHGGTGGAGAGGVGSVYLKTEGGAGILRIDNHGSAVGSIMPLGNPGDTSFVADHLVIAGTGTVVAPEHNMPIVANRITLENGGVLTHRATGANEIFSLEIEASELFIDAVSRIDVTGKGYLVGRTAGNTTFGGAKGRAGGTHGGEGFVPVTYGPTNRAYGDYMDPAEPGSGGGTNWGNAGSGGGVIRITADSATIDGSVLANGGNGGFSADPAGSGGSIRLDVGTLSGAGIIAANGGNGYVSGGSGGGGRVAIYYEDMSGFSLANVRSHGGKGAGNAGGAGSVYLKRSGGMGTLRIDTHITANDSTPRALTPLGIPSDAVFQAERLVIAGRYSVAVPERAGLAIQADEIVIESGGALSHRAATTTEVFALEVTTGTLTIDGNAESRIDVSGKGYLVGRTEGNTTAGGASGTSGGGYGGFGFGALSNDTYGGPLYPYKPGSGGGTHWVSGGAGGGVAHIFAEAITVDGSIKANGGGGFHGGDTAGSGGSILISAVSLSGTGAVSATGGKGYVSGGSGGGGRIAVYLRGDMTLPQANITAAGGTGGAGPGEEGTVRMPEEPVFLWVDRDKFLFHDAVTLEWIALGLDLDENVFVDILAQGSEQSFSLASGVPGSSALLWDTTQAPDGEYQLHAVFKNSSFQTLGEAVRSVLVNNSVTWHSGEIVNNETWASDEVHLVEGDVTIAAGKTLTVKPGAIIKFAPGTRLIMQNGAALQGEGTETQPIIFTSLADDEAGGDTNLDGEGSKPQPGDWLGFTVQGDGELNLSGNVEVRYSLHEHSGALGADETWLGKFLHRVTGTVTVPNGITLTIEPGAVVKFNRFLGITVQPGGRLVAEGTVAMPIVFTSALDDAIGGDTNRDGQASFPAPGDWRWIYIDGAEAIFRHVQVLYGGGNSGTSWDGTGVIRTAGSANLTVANSLVRDSFYDGVLAWGGTATITNSVFTGIDRAICAHPGSVVHVVNSTLDDNRIGLLIHGGTLNVTNTIVTNSIRTGVLWDHGADLLTMAYSNVWNPDATNGNYEGTADRTGSNGNLSVDPLYRSASSGNYRLRYLSPMIDAADGVSAPETDFMGAPRYDDPRSENTGVAAPSGAFPDMGAFEFVETAQSDVDLVVTAVNLPAEPGSAFTVTWQVGNQGVETARGSWYDALYLSSDKLWTPDDILLSTHLHTGDLGPGQSYTNTGEVVLPQARPGHYYVIVRTNPYQDLFEGVNQYNNTRASSGTVFVDLPSFAPGGAVTGAFQHEGDVQYFELLVPARQDLSIELSGPQGASTGLYVRRGELPTLQDFQWRSVIAGSTNQYLSLNNAIPGSYFVMVAASSLTAPGEFNLSARTSEFSIRGVRPEKGGNGGKVTVTIEGALFDGSTRARLIDSGGRAVEAARVYFADSGALAATFDLSGCALGMADVQAVTGENVTATLSRGFEILPSVPGALSANVDVPAVVRAGRDFKLYVEYLNVGLQDLVAPILRLKVPASIAAVGLSPQMEDATPDLWMVAVNPEMPAGILPPGARGRITVFGRTTAAGNIHYSLDLSVYGPQQIDWAAVKKSLRPADMSETEWDLLFAQIRELVGQGWDDYKEAVSDRANLLTPLRGAPSSLYEIFQLIVDQAMAALNPSVYGTAFLADGNHPLPNARLTLWDESTGAILTTVTLQDGTYLFPDVPGGSYSLEIDGYFLDLPITVIVAAGDVAVPDFIAAEQIYSVSGKVFTLPDGMPVPNQLVALVESGGASYTAVTGEDGSYRVEGLPAGTFAITASHEYLGGAEVWDIRLEPGTEMQTVHLGLSTGSTISGTLTGHTGQIPEDSSVYAVDKAGRVRGVGGVSPSGAYSITGLMSGVYDLYTHVPGTVRQRAEGVVVGSQSFVTGINMTPTAAGAVEGTLSVSGGSALPYQFVAVMAGETFHAGGITDGNGRFAVTGLAPGIYSVRAQVIGYLPVEASVMFEAGGTALVDLVVAPAAVISGSIVDGEGNLLVGAVVGIRGPDGSEIYAVTDHAGSYEMGDLLPDTYTVYVGNPESGAMSGEVSVVAGSGGPVQADFIVQIAGKITGTVMEADGTTPIGEATVQLFKDGRPVGSTETDENGLYDLQVLIPGDYGLAAFTPGKSFALADGLFVGEGSETVIRDFTAGAQSQAGQVLSEQTGKAVPQAIVSVYQKLFTGVYELFHETGTDGQGNFSVSGLAPGNYMVVTEKAGSAFGEGEFIVGEPLLRGPMDNNPPGTIALKMGPSSSVLGRILNDSGQPIKGAEVMLTYSDGDRVLASVAADDGGNYAIHGLPGGNFDAVVSADGHRFSRTTIIVPPGGSATLDGELGPSNSGVSGQVTAGGRPVPQAFIVARDDKNRPLEMRVTGRDGAFELNRLVPGDYGMTFTSEGNTPATGVIDLPPDVIVQYQQELERAANDPNSPWNRFAREFHKNIEWLRTLGPKGIEWIYKNAYPVEKDGRHPAIVPDAALDYCKPHRAHAVRMTQWADLQFELWEEAQMNSMSLINNAERVGQWLILGKEVALVFLPLAEKLAKLDKTLKTIKRLRNVQRWYSISKRFEQGAKLAQRLNNMNNFVKGLTAIYDRLNQPEPIDPAARRSQADGFLADMNDLAGLAAGQTSEWAETARWVKQFEQELKLAGQATSEALFVLGELSGILSIFMQAETAWTEWFEVGKNIASSRADYENRYKEYQAAVNRAYNAIILLQLCNEGIRIPPPNPPGASPIGAGSFTSNQAIDPNEKTGPAAWGAEGFIQAGPLTYRIDFENDPKFATAAAQEVFITDELDENLDLATFEFLGFGFSNRVFEIPPGRSRYWTRVDLRPENKLVVGVFLLLDPQTRTVSATFRSLDPQTMLLTEDPAAGFLPVNNEHHDGEGFVAFSIRIRPDLGTGAEVRNKAEIVFDVNDPIITNEVFHTLDSTAPISRVGVLPPAVFSRMISLNLTGSDGDGSGIQFYDIYVSENEGPYTYWLTTSESSIVFPGECGHRYSFYTVALDYVGNMEEHPLLTDVLTEVLSIMGDTDSSGEVDLADMIVTLQSMNKTEETDLGANICADVNEDGRIGMEEVIYILQWVSGVR